MYRSPSTRSFSLVELLAIIAIIAVMIAGAMFFVSNYVTWAKGTSDKQTYTILNDALTRYKCEGGNVGNLTNYVPISNVIASMQTPITLAGRGHIVLATGASYPSRSIDSAGIGAQYHFVRYNTYRDGSSASTSGANGTVTLSVTCINCTSDTDPMQYFLCANGFDLYSQWSADITAWMAQGGDGVQIHLPQWVAESKKHWYALTPSFTPSSTSTTTCTASVPPGSYALQMWDIVSGTPPSSNAYFYVVPPTKLIYVPAGGTVNINVQAYDDGAQNPNFYGGYNIWLN